jgi:hypothetical protein
MKAFFLLFLLGLPHLGLAAPTSKAGRWASSPEKSSRKLHQFFRSIKSYQRKLVPGAGPPPGKFFYNAKIGSAMGGAMSVKLPDVPSPIFVNQNPFYSFI